MYSEDDEIVTQDGPGLVYIIYMHGTNFYKIGRTTRTANERRDELQVGNPLRLDVVQTFNVNLNEAAEAAALHAAKAAPQHYRLGVNGGTEWFFVSPENYVNFHNTVRNAVHPWG